MGRIYRRTDAGEKALESQSPGVPADYRLIVGLIESDMHAEVIRRRLRRYPEALVDEWLEEIEDFGLLESRAEAAEDDLDFTSELSTADLRAAYEASQGSGERLSRKGVYLAHDRIRRREPSTKAMPNTVVLIAGDNPDQLTLADARVTMAGYAVRIAESVTALPAALAQGVPDVVLLDLGAASDGLQTLTALRRDAAHSTLPLIILAARSEADDTLRGLSLGADAYVLKPYSRALLAEVLATVLRRA